MDAGQNFSYYTSVSQERHLAGVRVGNLILFFFFSNKKSSQLLDQNFGAQIFILCRVIWDLVNNELR